MDMFSGPVTGTELKIQEKSYGYQDTSTEAGEEEALSELVSKYMHGDTCGNTRMLLSCIN